MAVLAGPGGLAPEATSPARLAEDVFAALT
jgi:hypothetical protein